jgi:hypothetical protein
LRIILHPQQDLYVYVSEKPEFAAFNDSSALVWAKNDLWYGDFYSGENQDGTFTFSTTLPTTEVKVAACQKKYQRGLIFPRSQSHYF